jgi:hypothetical protein
MLLLSYVLTLIVGLCGGFAACWWIARSGMVEIEGVLKKGGYEIVDGEWMRPDNPAWKPD